MASKPAFLRDKYGSKVITGRTQDGECLVSITNGLTCVMAVFTDEGFDQLRELLDRAAMPGQGGAERHAEDRQAVSNG